MANVVYVLFRDTGYSTWDDWEFIDCYASVERAVELNPQIEWYTDNPGGDWIEKDEGYKTSRVCWLRETEVK